MFDVLLIIKVCKHKTFNYITLYVEDQAKKSAGWMPWH